MLLELIALSWLVGCGMAAIGAPILLAPLAALLFAPWWKSPRWSARAVCALLVASLAVAGATYVTRHRPSDSPTNVSHFIGVGPTRVRGVVAGDRDERLRSLVLHLNVSEVEDDRGWHPSSGTLLLRLPLFLPYQDGDRLEVRGKLVAPEPVGTFDYPSYLAAQGVYAESDYPATHALGGAAASGPKHALVILRQDLDRGIRWALPEPEASLGAGLAFGTSRVTDPRLSADLQMTDADMIAVATGYNVTVVGLLVLAALACLIGRRQAAIVAIGVALAYALLIGFYPSVIRAAVMAVIVLVGAVVGRPHGGGRALIVACAIMTLDPTALLGVSFPLSTAAAGGAVWLSEPFSRPVAYLFGVGPDRRREALVRHALADSAGMTFATIGPPEPVLMLLRHTFSLASFPANLLLFPLVPALTVVSALTAIAGAFRLQAALLLAPAAYLLLHAMILVVRLCAAIPYGSIRLDWLNLPQAVTPFVALAGLGAVSCCAAEPVQRFLRRSIHQISAALRTPAAQPASEAPAVPSAPSRTADGGAIKAPALAAVALVVGTTAGLLGGGVIGRPSPAARLIYLDVGAGSAVLVQSGGSRVLVDGGPPGEATLRALDAHLPPWERSLNAVVITGRGGGDVGGLPAVLDRYRVGAIVDGSAAAASQNQESVEWRRFEQDEAARGARQIPRGALTLRLGQTALTIAPAAPDSGKLPATPATVTLRVDGRTVVLAGDAPAGIAADVRTLSPSELTVPLTRPRVEVLQTGTGPAAQDALPSLPLALRSALVYRTTENGSISVDLYRSRLAVRVNRGPRLGLFAAR